VHPQMLEFRFQVMVFQTHHSRQKGHRGSFQSR
jgi:hypothetical protein